MFRLVLLCVAAALTLRADSKGVTVDPGGPLLHRSDVEYPRGALERGIEGTIVLELSLDQNGEVTGIDVISGPAELRAAALRSVADWHYSSEMDLPAKVHAIITFKSHGPSGKPDFQMPSGPLGTLRLLDISGLTERAADALRARLLIHEGDALTPGLVEKARQIALEFDSHIMFTIMATGDGSYIRIMAPGHSDGESGPANTPQRIRVGSAVQAAKLLSCTPPVMPALAQQARISGLVRLNVVIGKDGHVKNITVSSGHPLLVPAAIESVKTYVYQPTLLNGQPMEVVTQVEVSMPAEPGVAIPPPSGPTPQ